MHCTVVTVTEQYTFSSLFPSPFFILFFYGSSLKYTVHLLRFGLNSFPFVTGISHLESILGSKHPFSVRRILFLAKEDLEGNDV